MQTSELFSFSFLMDKHIPAPVRQNEEAHEFKATV